MKIIAVTEVSYGGGNKKYLLEISTEEIRELTGTEWRDAEKLKLGSELKISNIFKDVLKIRHLYNEKESLTKRLKEICTDIESIKLPEEHLGLA